MRRTVLAAALLGLTGCGEKLLDVTGTVTYDGKPLPAGSVFLDPLGDHGMKAPQGYCSVRDGRFDTRDGGRGIRPGPYLIRVDGFDGQAFGEFPLGKPLFANFQEKRELGGDPVTVELVVPKKK